MESPLNFGKDPGSFTRVMQSRVHLNFYVTLMMRNQRSVVHTALRKGRSLHKSSIT